MKRTAVITDASSEQFWFPVWLRYYGGLFGPHNLHVVTYAGMKSRFAAAGLGNVWEVNAAYHDQLRARVIADLTVVLLNNYDVVIRCDVDEFIVPNPTQFSDLTDFIDKNQHPYVTASGINMIELGDDALLEVAAPVLGNQRRYAMRSAALSKTCLTTVPLRWAGGFHAANVFPHFAGLFNFHMKFADLKGRIAWHDAMLKSLTPGTSEYKYFAVGTGHLTSLQKSLAAKPKRGEEGQGAFDRRFLDTVTYNRINQIYQGEFLSQNFLYPIAEKFDGIF